jgi:hypothetical protein
LRKIIASITAAGCSTLKEAQLGWGCIFLVFVSEKSGKQCCQYARVKQTKDRRRRDNNISRIIECKANKKTKRHLQKQTV